MITKHALKNYHQLTNKASVNTWFGLLGLYVQLINISIIWWLGGKKKIMYEVCNSAFLLVRSCEFTE